MRMLVIEHISTVIVLALALGAISMTVTKSRIFRGLREKVENRSEFWGELISCPYCFGHWLSLGAMLIWHPRLLNCGVLALDYVMSGFALVALSALVSGAIYKLFASS